MPRINDPYKKLFPYLTRVGISPKFGSRPIGWYQKHQICAIERLESIAKKIGAPNNAQIKVKDNMVQMKIDKGWINIGSPNKFYNDADDCSRNIKR